MCGGHGARGGACQVLLFFLQGARLVGLRTVLPLYAVGSLQAARYSSDGDTFLVAAPGLDDGVLSIVVLLIVTCWGSAS